MLPTNKKQAVVEKSKYYFTGRPCKHGHLTKRATHNGACYECTQLAGLKCYFNNRSNIETRKQQIINSVRNRAKRNGEKFDIDVNSIIWPECCPIFGYRLSYDIADKDRSVSLDKHDPTKGYTKGNVVVMSLRANRAKWNLNFEEVSKLYEYFLSQQRS